MQSHLEGVSDGCQVVELVRLAVEEEEDSLEGLDERVTAAIAIAVVVPGVAVAVVVSPCKCLNTSVLESSHVHTSEIRNRDHLHVVCRTY